MIVVHQAAEVEHIRVVPFTVQAIQNGDKPAPQAWEHDICIPSYLHVIAAQPGQVFDKDKVDNAIPGILQHFHESGALKIAAAIPIVYVRPGFYPAVEHNKPGE